MRERRRDLLVVGHLNLDHEMQVERLPGPDRTVPVISRQTFLGGTACNIARWAARLGITTALSAFVGPDLPSEFGMLLRKEGVDIQGVVPRKGQLTPACWITRDGNGRQATLIDQGAMADIADELLPKLKGVRWVHLTTGDPGYHLRVARAARELGIPVACDPAQEIHYRWNSRQLTEMLGMSSVFFANRSEAARAVKMLGLRGPGDLTSVVPLAVVTLGDRGARAYTRRGIAECPAHPVKQKLGVTGAGDAFRGGFYAGWLKGDPLEGCLEQGARAGALVVGSQRELFLPPLSPLA